MNKYTKNSVKNMRIKSTKYKVIIKIDEIANYDGF